MSLLDDLQKAAGGGKSASFPTLGTTWQGPVISCQTRQSRNLDTGELESWDDGNPKMNLVVVIATPQRESADDDGQRGIYIKYWGDSAQQVIKCLRESGATDIEPGGHFTATFSSQDEPAKKGHSGVKHYTYAYRPPTGTGTLAADVAAAPQQQAPAQQQSLPYTPPTASNAGTMGQAAQAAPAAAPAQMTPQQAMAQVKELGAQGFDAQMIHELVPQFTTAAIQAVLNTVK